MSDLSHWLAAFPGVILDRVGLVRYGGELSLELGRAVDIGILDSSNLVYAKEALTTGTLLWTSDQGGRENGGQNSSRSP